MRSLCTQLVCFLLGAAVLQGTIAFGADTFTYQGRLLESGTPLNGTVDLRFTLYDEGIFPAPVAGPLLVGSVPVVDGLVTVDLNFGPGHFVGAARSLEIEVASPAGSGVFETLSPRQPIQATPYALYAKTAGALPAVYGGAVNFTSPTNQFSGAGAGLTGLNASNISTGTLASGRLSGSYSQAMSLTNAGNAFTGDGTGLINLNWANLINVPAGFADGIDNGGQWQVTGSTVYYTAGKVGVGTSSVGGLVEIEGFTALPTLDVTNTNNVGSGVMAGQFSVPAPSGIALRGHATHATGANIGVEGRTSSTSGKAVFGNSLATNGFTFGVFGEVDSPLGVGVYGESTTGFGTGVSGKANGVGGRGVTGWASAGTGNGIGVYGESSSASGYGGYFNGRGYFSGNVGIGDASPDAMLDVETASGIAFSTYQSAAGGVTFGLISDVNSSSGYAGYFVGGRNYFSGNVGIGTSQPALRLHVDGGSDVEPGFGGYAVFGPTSSSNLAFDNNEIMARNNGATTTLYLNNDGGNVSVCAGGGMLITPVIQITGGSDLSEQFEVAVEEHGEIEPGMVVCIDPANPGQLIVSTNAYAKTVAGIISGAGGVNTGMLMGQGGTIADGAHPVALTGRVYCHVDATEHAVEPGDLLTTSSMPGHAMKATDASRSHGSIIGKAMTSLDQGERGLVLVLVSLH